MTTEQKHTPYEVIYLQWHGEDCAGDCDDDHSHDECTWCQDEIYDRDIKYVRADIHDTLAAKVKELEAQQAEAIHCLKYIKQCLNDGIGIDALKDYRIDETLAKIEIGVSK